MADNRGLDTPTNPSRLPEPGPDALAHAGRVLAMLRESIRAAGGWISFERYVELALYAPGLGYYAAGSRKLGPEGDFTTAPELTPIFGQTLARTAAELHAQGLPDILEIGAGSGALAASMLEELARLDALPGQYLILELSPDLRERSRDTLARRVPQLMERVAWLSRLPPAFDGLVLGNEVLDAMPFALVVHDGQGRWMERGVGLGERDALVLVDRPASGGLLESAQALAAEHHLPAGYTTEIQREAQGFVRSLGAMPGRGVVLMLDYGFPAREYYHPQRHGGTMMCHYRHRAHDDALWMPGLQDITTHVDFTAMAQAAVESGMELAGYTSQAAFLIASGITEVLARTPAEQAAGYLPQSNAVQRLTSPAEMGELFKAIAFTRGVTSGGVPNGGAIAPLAGFAIGDRSMAL